MRANKDASMVRFTTGLLDEICREVLHVRQILHEQRLHVALVLQCVESSLDVMLPFSGLSVMVASQYSGAPFFGV